MSKLTREHIVQGAFIWYGGRASMGGWNCPAVITRVCEQAQVFYVKSLDDMVDQFQPYDFDVTPHASESRKVMRPATSEEVFAYLDGQAEALSKRVSEARRAFRESMDELRHFRAEREKLLSDHLPK